MIRRTSLKSHVCLLTALVFLTAFFFIGRDQFSLDESRRASYLGRTSVDWAVEIRRYECWWSGFSAESGRFAVWRSKPNSWESILEGVGLIQTDENEEPPLLRGDGAATDVLIELLDHSDPLVRRFAIQGIKNVWWAGSLGNKTDLAIRALLRMIDDPDRDTREDVEDFLRRLDISASDSGKILD